MKLKLFNGAFGSENLDVQGGGYDHEIGRVVLIVRGDHDVVGSILIDPSEALRIAAILNKSPKVERVEVAKPTPADPLGQK